MGFSAPPFSSCPVSEDPVETYRRRWRVPLPDKNVPQMVSGHRRLPCESRCRLSAPSWPGQLRGERRSGRYRLARASFDAGMTTKKCSTRLKPPPCGC